MDYFKENLKALEKKDRALFLKIKNYKSKDSYVVTTSNHSKQYPNLLHKPTNRLCYDNFDPLTPILRMLKSKIKVPVLNLFFGFGLGYELIGFFQNYANAESVMVVIDPEIEPFYQALKTIDLKPVLNDGRVAFLIDVPESELYVKFNQILLLGNLKLYVKAINIIDNPVSLAVNKAYYKKAMGHLKDAIREVLLHFGNDPWDSLIGIENTFLNINEIINYPGIKDLKDKFKDKPGIVVATGPSLNKNIQLLRGLENKAVICAVDASVKVMKKHSLKPHLVTSLERLTPTAKLFEGLSKEDVENVYLAATPVIHPQTYANFPGERIIVYRNFATFKWLDIEKGTLDIGPSAGNMAFKVLEFMGCNPIILIGQDLAFGEDDTTHAKGATYGEKEEVYHTKRQILEVEGNFVPKIKTTDVWYKFLKYYEKDIAGFKGQVINATEGGAKIPGTKVMYFKDAIEEFIKEDIDPIYNIKKNLKYPSPDEKRGYALQTEEKVKDAIAYADEVIKVLVEGVKKCEMFKKEIIDKYNVTKEIDHKLSENIYYEAQLPLKKFTEKKFYEIFMHFVQSYYLSTLVEINGVRAQDISNIDKNFATIKLLYDMYAVMIKLIEVMKKSLIAMEEKLLNFTQ